MILSKRTQNYTTVSNTLACMSNPQLQQVLSTGKAMHTGIGGISIQIEVENIPVFVKKVPLTALELEPENFMSTANLFNLPMCYQYGIGSAGFNAWRELAAHAMTTNWVISGKCPNFPILYSWRIIPNSLNQTDLSYWDSTENYLDYWENNEYIKNRVESLSKANSSILLFLEHFPKNLYQQLNDTLSSGNELRSIKYLEQLNQSFETVLKFMQNNNFLHMDAHFRNILADEDNIYLSDFGLASSKNFDLSQTELNFMNSHKLYDSCSYSVNFLHGVLTSYAGADNWDKTLNEYFSNKLPITLPDKIQSVLSKHALVAEQMHRFYKEIQKDKSTPYPVFSLTKEIK
ncbi:hypothetical protein DM455_13085 [Legionella pneumophila]|uniref:protein kinase n=1 Tax=Legionella pneumophila TaxID=446 RepID=UPI000770A7CF|nr:protein kinase [Legionella pneumophila]HAT8870873.1 protein kinase [Legionella pneumophila subsp. pneumophila]MDF1929640.1 protein kinase [Legionella pneumophila]PYB42857.1 hypothetical protein DM454_12645 [Legionella pneumophila]PYB48076.1 hypothetical protein DM456_13750 [Legionella pneumophila]PYB60661.1 hypothetical protein DM455_13085 [Legionella pneumophila]